LNLQPVDSKSSILSARTLSLTYLHCALAAAQCIVISHVCGWVCLWVCYHDNSLEIACIDPHQTGFIGCDHLQLIKLWPSRARGKGVCGGTKIFGSALLQPARSVCVFSECVFRYLLLQCFDTSIWAVGGHRACRSLAPAMPRGVSIAYVHLRCTFFCNVDCCTVFLKFFYLTTL